MITSLRIANVASYGPPQVLSDLSQFNFCYGSNGTGKTTISKVIADELSFPTCSVSWEGGTKLQTTVYNRDFITRNFSQAAGLKGIFTLGEESIDTLNAIANKKADVDASAKKIQQLTGTLQGEDGAGGKKGDLSALEDGFKETCWKQKRKHDPKLSGAFEGFRNNAENFKRKVLSERTSNSATVERLADLEKRAETVFGPTPTSQPSIIAPNTDELIALESDPLLTKRVIGRKDVDIAAMIQKLGNSDWVKAGRAFYEVNDKRCPFCQQTTPDALAQNLREYFDETFERDSKAIEELVAHYETNADRVCQCIDTILAAPPKFLDAEKLKTEKALLDSRITLNRQRMGRKLKEPSQSIELESLANVLLAANRLIDDANHQIAAHNKMVANLVQARADLTAQVWKYLLVVELKDDLAAYESNLKNLNAAIKAVSGQIVSLTTDKSEKEADIRRLERSITSIQPTIDAINVLLSSFGFLGFSLAKGEKHSDYKLVRPDGTDAKESLSEGEERFITFLYFYYLLRGSNSDSGIATDRVVVFDDPVSSLDSDIAFVVSSLIKGLFDEVRSGTGYIKQIFILTHNVYFHREVTFNTRRVNKAMKEETFWIVRKPGLESILEKHTVNPIKTSYDLLWAEVRNPERSNHTIRNTLRRILEHYFQILGGFNRDKICGLFEGKDKLICNSLFSWVNYGSHCVDDDLFVSIDDSGVETYLRVFRAVFQRSGHLGHYKMMMGDAYVDAPAESKDRAFVSISSA